MSAPNRPYRNPDFPDDRRQRYILKRILTERAAMERIGQSLAPSRRTLRNIVKNYLASLSRQDHVTYLILSQIIFGLNIGVPRTPQQRLDIEHACDRTSGLIGQLTENTRSVSIARELDQDSVTGDIEFVVYDARNRQDLNPLEEANGVYVGTRERRMRIKIENAQRPRSIRRRLLGDENDRGII